MQDPQKPSTEVLSRKPWNKGKLTGAKPPLRAKHVWAIRSKLQAEAKTRDPVKPPGDPPAPLERYFESVIGQQGQSRAFSGEFSRVDAANSSAIASEIDMVHASGAAVFVDFGQPLAIERIEVEAATC